jgi:hypothetical protein
VDGGSPAADGAVAPSGYSGTPLARKLGVKAHHRLVVHGAPVGWAVPDLPEGVRVMTRAAHADVVVAFFRQAAALTAEVARLGEVIAPDGSLWVAWPRRAAGHASDITDNVVRQVALPLGLVDVKVAAIDNDWSALKLVWRTEERSRWR